MGEHGLMVQWDVRWGKTMDDAFLLSTGTGSFLLLPAQEHHISLLMVPGWQCQARSCCQSWRSNSGAPWPQARVAAGSTTRKLSCPQLHPYAPGDACCDPLCYNLFFLMLDLLGTLESLSSSAGWAWAVGHRGTANLRHSILPPEQSHRACTDSGMGLQVWLS